MSINTRISKARKEKGFTQEELAGLANVTVRTIQRIESGESIPRSYTLKAIASALGLSYGELVAENTQPATDTVHRSSGSGFEYLKLLNLTCFAYLVIPFVHFLAPLLLQKKQRSFPEDIAGYAGKIIRQQIWWVVALQLLMLLTLLYNYVQVSVNDNRQYFVNYLWPFFFMYLLNAGIIGYHHFRIQALFKTTHSRDLSCI